ncbi:MAG TPA: putative metal-dependent hydrolase [Thermoanaerobaculia bacterium]|nr:putative metal-dependent hydrolase [Thermoanaerobaculia bacterium]
MHDPRYPIGKFEPRDRLTSEERRTMIEQIATAPLHMRDAASGLTPAQLDTPYREGGWTIRQVVHHVPDSHVNAYCRFKLALTEDTPTIRPYDETRWAELADSHDTPIKTSLTMLESLHSRWVCLLRSMKPDDFQRKLKHPESGVMTVDNLLALYAWHGRHHTAHITSTRERHGW